MNRWEGVAGQKKHPDVDYNKQIRVQNTLEINMSRFCGASMSLSHEFYFGQWPLVTLKTDMTIEWRRAKNWWNKKKQLPKNLLNSTPLKIGFCVRYHTYSYSLFIFNAYFCMRSAWWMDFAHVYRTPLN